MNDKRIAVALSIYKSDKVLYIKKSIDSILSQNYIYLDLYVQVDGKVSGDVFNYLKSIENVQNIFITYNPENMGLAFRLNQIIDEVVSLNCYAFLARMDADDISLPNRFQTQVDFLTKNPSIYVVGSDVIEFSSSSRKCFYKKMQVDNEQLCKNIIKRCPLNHPSVMFSMAVFSKYKLRYKSELMNTQDYYLWVDMIDENLEMSNINEALLKFRVDDDFHKRRGLKKAINEFNSRLYAMKKLKIYSFSNVLHTIMLFSLRMSPEFIKKIAYSKLR